MEQDRSVIGFLKKNWLLVFTILYVLSPFDFIPEIFFGPLGGVDDIGIILLELRRQWMMYNDRGDSSN